MHFRQGAAGRQEAAYINYSLRNRPGAINLGIVMYSQLPLFERHCGPLEGVGIIHLLRDPLAVAKSVCRMRAEKAALGPAYRPHYSIGDRPHTPLPADPEDIERCRQSVGQDQAKHAARLAGHARILTLTYEELTGGVQTNRLPEAIARRLVEFLGLPWQPLENRLQKTGQN